MSEALAIWIKTEVERRGWSYRELSRQAGVSHPLVSRTLSGDMAASADFCIKVAAALGEPPEAVLKLAGILPAAAPASPDDSPDLQALVEIARRLPSEQRRFLLDFARWLLGRQ